MLLVACIEKKVLPSKAFFVPEGDQKGLYKIWSLAGFSNQGYT